MMVKTAKKAIMSHFPARGIFQFRETKRKKYPFSNILKYDIPEIQLNIPNNRTSKTK